MTLKERMDMIEQKTKMLNERGWKCEVCGKPLTLDGCQLAHKMPKSKRNLKIYGKGVIHHPLNMACVCSLKCNDAVLMNIATNPIESRNLIGRIKEALKCS
jgi:hypothetical protein